MTLGKSWSPCSIQIMYKRSMASKLYVRGQQVHNLASASFPVRMHTVKKKGVSISPRGEIIL
jgi:hypothetical protein